MYVLAVSAVSDEERFWSALKRAHAALPRGAAWKLAVASKDGGTAVNVLTHDSVESVRAFLDGYAGEFAATEYTEADAADAVGLPR
jgi:uncharacterized iron-regulated membrane protein